MQCDGCWLGALSAASFDLNIWAAIYSSHVMAARLYWICHGTCSSFADWASGAVGKRAAAHRRRCFSVMLNLLCAPSFVSC